MPTENSSRETPRLLLHPFAPRDLLALRESAQEFEQQTGCKPAEGLREFLVSGELSPAWLDRLRAATAADPWQFGFGAVERSSGSMIGTGMFKGPPDEAGVVEIAYGIVPSREGRGYATEVASALVAFASADPRVRRLHAHTLPENNASGAVLTKCGFTLVGPVEDPEDGLVWRWTRDPI